MTATRRKYTRTEKAQAVGTALAVGVTEAERQLGIPKETIHYWTKTPEFAQLRTTARESVAEQMWVALQRAMSAIVAAVDDPEVPLRDKATAFATLYDRHALLTGGATARSESRDITGTLADADIAAAIRAADDLTRRGSSGTAEAPAGETTG